MKNSMARCVREINYEEWNSYVFNEEGIHHVNTVCIFLREYKIVMYLLYAEKEDVENYEYLKDVVNLVKDLTEDFELKTQFLSPEMIKDVDVIIDEIRKREGVPVQVLANIGIV